MGVTEWPSWGTWTFTPSGGDNLQASDDPVTVNVSVVAPDERRQDFDGEIRVVNKQNESDIHMVRVTLSTPFISFDWFENIDGYLFWLGREILPAIPERTDMVPSHNPL